MSFHETIPLVPAGSPSHTVDISSDTQPVKPEAREHIGLSEHPARRSRICGRNLIPVLATFVLTSGLGIGVLVWLSCKLSIPLSEAFRDGHFLVDEGVKRSEGSVESATLRTLTATSFISTIISATCPLLTGLVAYRIAHLWAMDERNASNKKAQEGPTPLQYGLLLQVLNAPTIMSITGAVRYSMRASSRAAVPSFFTTAVTLVSLVFVLTHLVGLADLWMHATTSAVMYNLTRSDLQSVKASLVFNDTLCGPYVSSSRLCLADQWGWASLQNDSYVKPIGQSIISNTSSDVRIITLADEGDLAIAIPAKIEQLATFKATTFGARAKCESLNVLCPPVEYLSGYEQVNCTNLGIKIVPTDFGTERSFVFSDPSRWNTTNTDLGVMFGPAQCCGTNPINSVLQLRWSTQSEAEPDAPNPAVYRGVSFLDIYARCNVTFYNMTVAYDGRLRDDKQWTVVPDGMTLSSAAFASILSGPLTWQLFIDSLNVNIRSAALASISADQVMAALSQELGRLSLGYIAGTFISSPATEVTTFHPTLLGRYPVAPTLTFVALLLVYGFLALAIFAISVNLPSDVISVPSSLQSNTNNKKQSEISTLELAQLRLLGPLPLVAQMFEPPIRDPNEFHPGDADAKSVTLDDMDMFADGGSSATRLRLGLEDTDIRPRYGVWRRE